MAKKRSIHRKPQRKSEIPPGKQEAYQDQQSVILQSGTAVSPQIEKKGKPWIWNLLNTLLALAVFAFGLVRDCKQESETELLSARSIRPNIVFTQPFRIKSADVDYDKIKFKDLLSIAKTNDSISKKNVDSVLFIQGSPNSVSFTASVFLKNTGNEVAKIRYIITGDTLSGMDDIRSILRDEQRRKASLVYSDVQDKFSILELQPNESASYDIPYIVRYLDDRSFRMHILVIYEGESTALYDTYYWADYNVQPMQTRPLFQYDSGKPVSVAFIHSKLEAAKQIVFDTSRSSAKIYVGDELKELKNALGYKETR